jgi:Na+/H+-dicarboxylate symporter
LHHYKKERFMNILKNYAFTISLLAGVAIGGVCGVIFGEGASVVKPFGDLFLNMLFVLVVPLVFLSVSSSIYHLKQSKMVGKVLVNILLVFLFCAVVAGLLAYGVSLFYNPLSGIDKSALMAGLSAHDVASHVSSGDLFVKTFTVSEFADLFSKDHLLPLIIFSIIFGLATALAGEKGKMVAGVVDSAMAVVMQMMHIIMYVAPIGLGCYFADTIGRMGGQILGGYLDVFLLFLLLTVVYYFGFNTLLVWLSGGRKGVSLFWHHIITPSLTAIATTSSAACIPINMEAAKEMGVTSSIAETVVPLGTNLHKDGSVMLGVIKIVFLMTIVGRSSAIPSQGFYIIGVALLVGVVMGAIPSGGMTGDLLTCAVFGFPPQLIAVLMVISTICDVPATLVNSTANVVSSVVVNRLTRNIVP